MCEKEAELRKSEEDNTHLREQMQISVNEFSELVKLAKDENTRKTDLFNQTKVKYEQSETNLSVARQELRQCQYENAV